MRFAAIVSALTLFLTTPFAGSALADETPPKAAALTKENVAFFETYIRPVLAEHCYSCHSTQARKLRGNLLLDSRPGMAKGGDNGPALVAGDVDKSRLIQAIRWSDADFVMPPNNKLTPRQIEKFEEWVKMGAPDPRTEPPSKTAGAAKTIDLKAGRNWWSFLPVVEGAEPVVKEPAWASKKIDFFVLQELEAKGLSPSAQADRAYPDSARLPRSDGPAPSYEESEAFAKNPSASAYAEIIERLLASPQYGQRWGRYWLDVARYGEDNPTSEATNPPYPFAWRYRDWVIDALNRDLPYNQFVTLQLAGDLVPGTPRGDLAATGFLGAGRFTTKTRTFPRTSSKTFTWMTGTSGWMSSPAAFWA